MVLGNLQQLLEPLGCAGDRNWPINLGIKIIILRSHEQFLKRWRRKILDRNFVPLCLFAHVHCYVTSSSFNGFGVPSLLQPTVGQLGLATTKLFD
ncbi:Uncharacterized protein TCM_019991 [Theobroma cacao]|uniref:Uncharacterized protein n=1 Tax=Theobroma cacao TaxID=3641 RepID=A0A061EK95_THECC|nr:Uncharacterized protein TCM_019991 [Theobroma cacao]